MRTFDDGARRLDEVDVKIKGESLRLWRAFSRAAGVPESLVVATPSCFRARH